MKGLWAATPYSSFPGGAPGNKQARLGVAGLDRVVCSLIDRGVPESTLRSYTAGKKHYLTICSQFNCRPLPVTEATLLRFTAHLASLGLSYKPTGLYLCAVCHLQIVHNLPEPSLASYPLLNYALWGLR